MCGGRVGKQDHELAMLNSSVDEGKKLVFDVVSGIMGTNCEAQSLRRKLSRSGGRAFFMMGMRPWWPVEISSAAAADDDDDDDDTNMMIAAATTASSRKVARSIVAFEFGTTFLSASHFPCCSSLVSAENGWD
jgi:hypothetical protein